MLGSIIVAASNFEISGLVRTISARMVFIPSSVAENRKLRLTLLHHDHTQVGRSDHAQIHVAVGIEADIS